MAKMPNCMFASVPVAKITGYLLNKKHPEGGPKAAFFEGCGFKLAAPNELAVSLTTHAWKHEVAHIEENEFVRKYVIIGELMTPSLKTPLVRVVWAFDRNAFVDGKLYKLDAKPWLITAFPE